MSYTIEKATVWIGKSSHTPGSLGSVLGPLSEAGANLEFLFARQAGEGKAVWFLWPLEGAKQLKAAQKAGLTKWSRTTVRVQGPNKKGLAAKITQALGAACINIQGLSGMGVGKSALFYIALDKADAAKAIRVLKETL